MRLLSGTGGSARPTPVRRKARRSRPSPAWRRRLARWSIPCLAIAGLGAAFGWAVQSGMADRVWETGIRRTIELTADAGLRIGDVLVEGRHQTRTDALLAAIAIRRDDPILAIDLDRIRENIETLPWVRQARVERRLPDTLHVLLVERRPLALWQRDGRFTLIDHDGEVITERGLERFRDLPVLIGDDAPRRASAALAMLAAEPELSPRIRALTWVGGRRWTVRLDGGIDVQLPESDPGRAWTQLASLARDHGVLERDIVTIDLRIPDQLILRAAPHTHKRAVSPGENT